MNSTSFTQGSNPSSLEVKKDPAGSERDVLYYNKYPNSANKGYNTEFTVNVGSYDAKKITLSFGVYVDSAEMSLLAGEESSSNYRMVQLYASDFFKPFIGLDKNSPGKWILGHLTIDDKTVNYTNHKFDFDKWYTVSIDMFLDSNTAIVYVDGTNVGSYNGCKAADAITSVRFLGQYRCKCDIYFDALVLSETDSTVNESYDFENGLNGVDYSKTHDNCVITPVADPKNKDNTVLKLDRTGNSGSYIFNLPTTEALAEALTLKFRIQVGSATKDSAELRIQLSNDNSKTPYMASLIKRASGFEIWDRASSTEANKKSKRISDETFALNSWYEITITLHISCCDYFIAEWTIVGEDGVEHKAYSQLFAMQDGDETKPETTVSHIRFWAVGNNWTHQYYLDDLSIRAGGSGAANGHHAIAKEFTSKDGYHFKECACCENLFAYEECTKTSATCTEKAYCTVCAAQYGEVNPDSHKISEGYTANAEKKTHYNTCDNGCGNIFNETACTVSEATCAAPAACTVCAHVYAPALDHTFEGDVTYNRDATATKDGTVTGYCSVCKNSAATGTLYGSAELVKNAYSGLTVSIIGDSISTYKNVSNGTAAETSNSTIASNSPWYSDGGKPSLKVGLNDTWWMQTINAFDTTLLVNNSWSGSLIRHKNGDTNGSYDTRALQLHDDTGANSGEEPDIIFVYMGTNDVNVHASNIGSVSDIDFNNIAALRAKDRDSLTVLEAYVIMIDNIKTQYENAEIYCLNVLNCSTYYSNETKSKSLADFNAGTATIAEKMGATYVDICNGTGINAENMEEYIPIYDDDDSDNNYHPNAAGMTLIADCVIKAISENSTYAPSDSEFLALRK
jgi:lysophospholipase L1-like esterase